MAKLVRRSLFINERDQISNQKNWQHHRRIGDNNILAVVFALVVLPRVEFCDEMDGDARFDLQRIV